MKKTIGLLFGGRSSEHEVSLQSAKNIYEAIDKTKYDVVLISIDKKGQWLLSDPSDFLLNVDDPKSISLKKSNNKLGVVLGGTKNQLLDVTDHLPLEKVDVVFPILHGTLGEDGSIQGLLRLMDIPYVGPNVLSSAMSFDKDITKLILKAAGIQVANSVTITRETKNHISVDDVVLSLGLPLFIKPANQGSSVGVSKAHTREELKKGIEVAFQYDHKVIVEEAIVGREIECAVLGNKYPRASIPGEVLPTNDFYSYEAKYIDEKGADLAIPADLTTKQIETIQSAAIKTFQALECEGLARVDFFLTEDDKLYVNEVNTLPGFTKISMYPKLWAISGVSYSQLIEALIDLAIERHERDLVIRDSM